MAAWMVVKSQPEAQTVSVAGEGVAVGGMGVGVGGMGVGVGGMGVGVGGTGVLVGASVSVGGGGVIVDGTDVATSGSVAGEAVVHPAKTRAAIINVRKSLGFIFCLLVDYSVCTSNAPMSQGVSEAVCTIGRNPPL